MICPGVVPWVIERGLLFGDRVVTELFVVFVTIATGTGESQIFQSRRPAVNNGNDVFHGKGIGGDVQRTEAVFTASGSAPFDGLPQTFCDSISQREAPASRVVSLRQAALRPVNAPVRPEPEGGER